MPIEKNNGEGFDLLSPDFIANPYPVYAKLRRQAPVFWLKESQSKGLWVVSRYRDVLRCLRNNTQLSSGRGRGSSILNALPEKERRHYAGFLRFYNLWLLLTDPPKHTRLRKLSNRGFSMGNIESFRPYIEELVDELLREALPKGRIDFLRDFAYRLPAIIIARLLGCPREDAEQLVEWSNDIAILIGLKEISLKVLHRIEKSYLSITTYFKRHIDRLKGNPDFHVLSSLIAAVEDEEHLTREELYAQCVVLLVGGHETTRNLLGNGLYLLFQHPDQMEKLKNDPDLTPLAVEEMLRFESPVQFVGRTAVEPFELNGQAIRENELIMLMIAAANRDEEVFENPESFNIERKPNKHLSFGLGVHYCLGAGLARLQTQIAFKALFELMPNVALASERVEWAPSPVFRGLVSMEVRF